MDKQVDAIQYSRAVHCTNLPHLGTTDIETFLKTAKEDWDIRAETDASSYVCSAPHASENDIQASGAGDVEREFLPRIEGFDHEVVCEIGCGFGRMTMFIASHCKQLYGLDISHNLLVQATRRLNAPEFSHVHLIETDGVHLNGVPDNYVDVAFEYIVFQHIPAPEIIISYIREVSKKLKSGGVFIMHGRDIPADIGGAAIGNTWHGCQCGTSLVRRAITGTPLVIVKEEGVGTERYWATLQKRG